MTETSPERAVLNIIRAGLDSKTEAGYRQSSVKRRKQQIIKNTDIMVPE